ncbi:RagB/SusD family nutrient uptake outer membrane protein [Mucilaginibacter ginkgonis]|uniref:RagB/SusD family nutrient uptake outer membrane protein n=1 Tax=Mucilaginibacter ginkgonis TaxID=2682091 RepID=A0A6I4HYP5_9SPHI|nr:RagB/SusD family nutrient uptake outer membrane protein [Mucilaginibacter ginkgonis]QQL51468.1 RagB/SusD family nutrient uptake outer membrane protein [Mucilaginibacter ginkgonis]
MKKRYFLITAAFLAGVSLTSCKKSLNTPQDSVTQEQAAGSAAYLNSIVLGTYASLQTIAQENTILQTADETTDGIIVPTRGTDWGDGGKWLALYQHTYNAANDNISNSWNNCYDAIGAINITLGLLKGLPQTTSTAYSTNELRVLRAYYYMQLVTNFGNIPLLTSASQDATTVKTTAAKDVFTYLITELQDAGPKLSAKTPAADPSQYGRINRWGAYFLLAKLYLNQNVITGTTDNTGYQNADKYCDSLIQKSGYSLQGDFLSNFSSNNTNSPENIFVIPFDHINAPGLHIQMTTLHYNQAPKYKLESTGGPWNGFTTSAENYARFNNADTRKQGWQAGQQYAADGVTPLLLRDGKTPLFFTSTIGNIASAAENEGVRVQKFQITPGSQNQDADFPLMRYADVLLMKAETQLRLGNTGTSLTYTAPVRARANMPNFTAAAYNADSLLNERGREFAYEGWRRQDMIRFGRFGDARTFKPADPDKHYQLMPIPTSAIQKNPNLTQNPGY